MDWDSHPQPKEQARLPCRSIAALGWTRMSHAYSEEQLVEQPAVAVFAELGWQTAIAGDAAPGADVGLERQTSAEVVLLPRLRAALVKLNPDLPPDVITAALDEI